MPVGAVVVPVVIAIARETDRPRGEVVPPRHRASHDGDTGTSPAPGPSVTASRDTVHHIPYVRPLVIGGGIAIGIGLGAGALAWQLFGVAQQQETMAIAMCGSTSPCPPYARANDTADRAALFGNVSTGLVVVGGAAVAAGAILWLVHRHDAKDVAVVPAAHGTGIAVVAHF